MSEPSVGTAPTTRPLHLTILGMIENAGAVALERLEVINALKKQEKRAGRLGKKSTSKLATNTRQFESCRDRLRALASAYIGAKVPADHDQIVNGLVGAIDAMKIDSTVRGNAEIFQALDWIMEEKRRAGPAPNPLPSPPPAPDQRDGGLDDGGQPHANAA